MGWIGVSDQQGGRFDAAGLAGAPGGDERRAAPETIVPRGTLMIEARLSPEGRPQTLLAFRRSHPWSGNLSIQILPSGGITLIETLGDDIRHATLKHDLDSSADLVRISYRWDAPARWGKLTLEHLGTSRILSVDVPMAHPMLLADLRMIIRSPAQRRVDRDVAFLAVSDMIEPIGPTPGLTAQVPVATPRGAVPVSALRRGDTVYTSDGDIVPVLQTVRQCVPAYGSFRPVRLRAPYFGLYQDILVAPQQRLVMAGSQVEYMFGTEAVLVPARHLVNRMSALVADGPDLVTYHDLLLPGHEAIVTAGCPMESLYIGRLRRKPDDLAASVLRGVDRNRLPEHARPIWPVLKPFEAITLALHRAA